MRFVLAFLMLFSALQSSAIAAADCTSPRAAVDSLFLGLGADSPNADGFCFDLQSQDDSERIAGQLLQTVDAKGLFIQITDFPLDSDPVGDDGVAIETFPIHTELQSVFVEKVGDSWLFSRGSLSDVSSIYAETFSSVSLWIQNLLPAVFSEPIVWDIRLWQIVWLSALVVTGWFLGWLAFRLLCVWLAKSAKLFDKELDSSLYKKLRRPTVWVLLGSVMSWGIPDLQLKVEISLALFFVAKLLISLAVVLLAMRVIDLVAGVMEEKAAETEGRMDDQLVPIVVKIMRLVVGVLGLVFVLQNLGVNVSALVAGLGVGGIAIALAAKDTLANVFGSITIFTDQPFHVGDVVDIDGVVGTVEEVGLRSTRVRTSSGSVMTIPNGKVANAKIDNIGARQYRRIRGALGLSYSTAPSDLTAFVEGFREILAGAKDVVTEKSEVHFTDFGASSLDVMFSFYLDVPGWHDELVAKSEINMAIMDLAAKLDVSFAFPSQSLYIESMPKR